MTSISPATARDDAEIDALLRAAPHALMHYSPRYWNFLRRLMPAAEFRCFVARDAGRIVGLLPAMCLRGSFGPVVNSLPFFGSHGGPWIVDPAADRAAAAEALVDALLAWMRELGAAAATVIDNPLDPQERVLAERFKADLHDQRIGQLLRLPPASGIAEQDAEALFAKFHQKTRNAVRKAAKSGFTVTHTDSGEERALLARMHADNITSLGGQAKPPEVFESLARVFRYDDEYRIYVARRDGRTVSALLVLYAYGTAEYFVPATLEEARSLQPMSLLITEAMKDAMARGCRLWNWGGTWESQAGVHMFKARWGSEDLPYRYHVRLQDRSLLRRAPAELLAAYPNFYVVPFFALEAAACC